MIHRTLKHYRVIAALGAGGMGEVYLAQDTKLDRKVALKILPPDVASNRDRMERFVREAKAAAALNHPNIAHIYEIGDSEGTPFIAMEYVDGVTLREKIHHSREPLSALLGYLAQVAEGLAKAHHAGIVHRDLKPDNVMITRDGYAKILDFGLAKLVESPAPFGIDQRDRTEPSKPCRSRCREWCSARSGTCRPSRQAAACTRSITDRTSSRSAVCCSRRRPDRWRSRARMRSIHCTRSCTRRRRR